MPQSSPQKDVEVDVKCKEKIWKESKMQREHSIGEDAEPEAADIDSGAETNLDSDTQTFTRDSLEDF